MDVLLEGSCKRTIKENGPESSSPAKIKHALFHDITRLPGKILVLDERTEDTSFGKVTGIYFETRMDESTEGNDTLIKYQGEIYDNHSIGYRELSAVRVERDGVHGNNKQWDRYMNMLVNPEKAEEAGYFNAVKEIRLYEGSTVGFGMNELTPFLGVKGKEELTNSALMLRFEKLEKILKLGSLSDESLQSAEIQMLQLKQVMSELIEKFHVKPIERKELVICNNCDEEVSMNADGTCPSCGSACRKEAEFSWSAFAKELGK